MDEYTQSPETSGQGASRPPIDLDAARPSPPPPPPGPMGYYPPPAPTPKRGGIFRRVAVGVISSLVLMLLFLNVYVEILKLAAGAQGPNEAIYTEGDEEHRIVILPIIGMIDQGTSSFVHEAIKHLHDNPPEALILRVNSGGGGVSASDRIWHDLTRFKEDTKTPIIASFGDIAASGGYYVAAPRDFIIAEPTSITGSIGVIAQAFTVHQLLEKIGITPEIIAATKATKKDMLNPTRAWDETDRQALRVILDEAYDRFTDIVVQGRPHLANRIASIATGEVFTSSQALEQQLIDGHGYLDDAIEQATKRAGIDPEITPQITIIHPSKSLMQVLTKSETTNPTIGSIDAEQIRRWLIELNTPRIEYRFEP